MIRRYLVVAGLIAGFVLASFLVVEALGVPLLVDPAGQFEGGGPAAAVLGVGLLIVDVFIPVPSSIVMTAQGALFGFAGGTALGMIGSVGATLTGFAIGRRGSRLINRYVKADDGDQSHSLLRRYGPLAIIVTRPLPILAETTAIMAGSTPMTWRQVIAGSLVGCLPAAALYSAAGAFSADIATGLLVFPLVLLLAGLLWALAWIVERRLAISGSPLPADLPEAASGGEQRTIGR
ncbi:MAG: VTT domain-containing protein [Chloroflexia bacterium]|nr:VTT domain-containing protein [Chloroflexia bacterium]